MKILPYSFLFVVANYLSRFSSVYLLHPILCPISHTNLRPSRCPISRPIFRRVLMRENFARRVGVVRALCERCVFLGSGGFSRFCQEPRQNVNFVFGALFGTLSTSPAKPEVRKTPKKPREETQRRDPKKKPKEETPRRTRFRLSAHLSPCPHPPPCLLECLLPCSGRFRSGRCVRPRSQATRSSRNF